MVQPTSTSPLHQITRINIQSHLTNKLNPLPTKNIFSTGRATVTHTTNAICRTQNRTKNSKMATDPKWAHFLGVLFCTTIFHLLGPGAMRMGGLKLA
jgi:hypothetical protein